MASPVSVTAKPGSEIAEKTAHNAEVAGARTEPVAPAGKFTTVEGPNQAGPVISRENHHMPQCVTTTSGPEPAIWCVRTAARSGQTAAARNRKSATTRRGQEAGRGTVKE